MLKRRLRRAGELEREIEEGRKREAMIIRPPVKTFESDSRSWSCGYFLSLSGPMTDIDALFWVSKRSNLPRCWEDTW